jgi:arginase family enzyme
MAPDLGLVRPSEEHTFLRCPEGTLDDLRPGMVAVVGVPFDATKITRPGAKDGPNAIRQGTAAAAARLQGDGLVDLDRDVRITLHRPSPVVDLGNLVLAPTDVAAMIERVSATVAAIIRRGAFPLVLGGDHFVAYPSTRGFVTAMREKDRNIRLGYVHVDQHLDLNDHAPYWGKHHSGTPARRITEIPGIEETRMVFLGINGPQPTDNAAFVRDSGVMVIPLSQVRREGIPTVMERVRETLRDCDAVYVSLDIDALDRSFAPGTGNTATIGGLFPMELLEIAAALRDLPLGAVDLAEVAPNWDPTGRTPAIGAAALFAILEPKLFAIEPFGLRG